MNISSLDQTTDKHACILQRATLQTENSPVERRKLSWPKILCCCEATGPGFLTVPRGPGPLSRGNGKPCQGQVNSKQRTDVSGVSHSAGPLRSSVPGDEKHRPGGELGSSPVALGYRSSEPPKFVEMWDHQHQPLFT